MTLPPPLQQVDRTYVRFKGQKLTYFGGCDYFRLASHPQVLRAAVTGLERYGLNVSASRATTGNHEIYGQLEKKLADYFKAESATLTSNGYLPNLIVAQTLAGQFSHALMDNRAHGSLQDAAQLLDCPIVKFRHRDAADLAQTIKRLGTVKPLLLTDGMFAHDGSLAPLKDYLAELPDGGMILLDDSHGGGTLGKNGRGTPEEVGVSTKRIIQTVTLSKAFGVYGGAVLGTKKLRAAILAKNRMFVGNTPLPLPLACAAIKSIELLKSDKSLRTRLHANIAYLKKKLSANGFEIMVSPSPVISVIPKSASEASQLKLRLHSRKIHAPFIKYPGGPPSGYFRFALSSEHTQPQLDDFAAALSG